MSKAPKFNFVSERQISDTHEPSTAFTASIYGNQQIVFNKDFIRIYELESKYVRLFLDVEKRAIGFSVVEGDTDFAKLNDARHLKPDAKGNIKVSIRRLLTKIGYAKPMKPISNLEIKTYDSKEYGGTMYYVTLPPIEISITSKKELLQ